MTKTTVLVFAIWTVIVSGAAAVAIRTGAMWCDGHEEPVLSCPEKAHLEIECVKDGCGVYVHPDCKAE